MSRHGIIIGKKSVSNWIDFILFFVMLICMRCMLLGNVFPIVGLASGAICFIRAARRTSNKRVVLFIVCCVFWGYCVLQGILLNANTRGYLIQIFVYWFIQAGVGFFLFSKSEKEQFVVQTLIKLLAGMSVSYIISMALGILVGWSTIKITDFDYNYFYNAPVYFPFTIAYGSGQIGGITFWRLLGIGRESGIMQCLYSWAYFVADHYFPDARRIKLLLMFGVVACFSTTGLVLFFAILALTQMTKNLNKVFSFQTLGIVLVVAIAAVLLMSESTFGLSFRLEKSFSDRAIAMAYGLQNLEENPLFGIGFSREGPVQSEINLIASLGNIGLVGGGLFMLVYITALIIAKDKRQFLTANGSFFLTAIIAQPLYFSPLMYLFLFTSYSKIQNVTPKNRRPRNWR